MCQTEPKHVQICIVTTMEIKILYNVDPLFISYKCCGSEYQQCRRKLDFSKKDTQLGLSFTYCMTETFNALNSNSIRQTIFSHFL